MPEQLWFTQILNRAIGGPVASTLQALHIHMEHPQAPISNVVAMQLLVVLFLLLLFLVVRSRLSVDSPGALQHIFEGAHNFIQGQSEEIIGHHSEGFGEKCHPGRTVGGSRSRGCNRAELHAPLRGNSRHPGRKPHGIGDEATASRKTKRSSAHLGLSLS